MPPKPVENLGKVCENSGAGENPRLGLGVFTDLLWNSPKRSSWFSPGYEGTENMFYFLIVLQLYICVSSVLNIWSLFPTK